MDLPAESRLKIPNTFSRNYSDLLLGSLLGTVIILRIQLFIGIPMTPDQTLEATTGAVDGNKLDESSTQPT